MPPCRLTTQRTHARNHRKKGVKVKRATHPLTPPALITYLETRTGGSGLRSALAAGPLSSLPGFTALARTFACARLCEGGERVGGKMGE
jgi:hypothetical protein